MKRVCALITARNFYPGLALFAIFSVSPSSQVGANRVDEIAPQTEIHQKEDELRAALKSLRTAISEYNQLCGQGALLSPFDRSPGDHCYPSQLNMLEAGVRPPGKQYRIVFLPKIPIDPFTGSADWGLRSFQDDKRAETWGGQNVFSVYSKSDKVATDGTLYRNW